VRQTLSGSPRTRADVGASCQAGAWVCAQSRNRETLLRVATLEEDYFDEDAYYAALVKYG